MGVVLPPSLAMPDVKFVAALRAVESSAPGAADLLAAGDVDVGVAVGVDVAGGGRLQHAVRGERELDA